MYIKPVIQQS